MSRTVSDSGTVVYGDTTKLHRYAVIEGGIVTNTISVDGEAASHGGTDTRGVADRERSRGAQCIRVDRLRPEPSVGWTYDGRSFAPPVAPPDDGEDDER